MKTTAVASGVRQPCGGERGSALVATLMAIALLLGLGGALIMTTTTEARIAANYRDGIETQHAAEAVLERTLADLAVLIDWNTALDGRAVSPFVDGPAGSRVLPGGGVLELGDESNRIRCGKPTPCSAPQMDAVTAQRPWGRNNPRWQLFAHGRLADLAPGSIDSRLYVVSWVADDPTEDDDDPMIDGGLPAPAAPAPNPGAGVILVRARAFGAAGVARSVEAVVSRGYRGIRVISWTTLE